MRASSFINEQGSDTGHLKGKTQAEVIYQQIIRVIYYEAAKPSGTQEETLRLEPQQGNQRSRIGLKPNGEIKAKARGKQSKRNRHVFMRLVCLQIKLNL